MIGNHLNWLGEDPNGSRGASSDWQACTDDEQSTLSYEQRPFRQCDLPIIIEFVLLKTLYRNY